MTVPTEQLPERIARLNERIANACHKAGRMADTVTLIAAAKTRTAAEVMAACAAGVTDFGENYLQESLQKRREIAGRNDALPSHDAAPRWHYIGAIQSNKTRDLARCFDVVHTVDRIKIARRLSSARDGTTPLDLCLQVNVDADPNKQGVAPESSLSDLLDAARALPGIRCRGLMTILSPETEPAAGYAALAELFYAQPAAPEWTTLSMGMSGDFETAIAQGATHVRIGTALFGPRNR